MFLLHAGEKRTTVKKLFMSTMFWWVLSLIIVLLGLVCFPSMSSVFAALAAALIIPVTRWQSMLAGKFSGKMQAVLVLICVVLLLVTMPAALEKEEAAANTQTNMEVHPFNAPGQTLIPMFGTEPTATPADIPADSPAAMPAA